MKIYNLPRLSEPSADGIFRLGPDELKTGAVGLLYGRLGPKESGRIHSTPDDKVEVVCVIKGTVRVERDNRSFSVSVGEAFFSQAGSVFTFSNPFESEAAYISASGKLNRTVEPSKDRQPVQTDANDDDSAMQAPVVHNTPHEAIAEAPEYDITRDDTDPID